MVKKYLRNQNKNWTPSDDRNLKDLAKHNTPTRVIGLKTGRSEDAVRSRASKLKVSLKPVNKSPYNRKKK